MHIIIFHWNQLKVCLRCNLTGIKIHYLNYAQCNLHKQRIPVVRDWSSTFIAPTSAQWPGTRPIFPYSATCIIRCRQIRRYNGLFNWAIKKDIYIDSLVPIHKWHVAEWMWNLINIWILFLFIMYTSHNVLYTSYTRGDCYRYIMFTWLWLCQQSVNTWSYCHTLNVSKWNLLKCIIW